MKAVIKSPPIMGGIICPNAIPSGQKSKPISHPTRFKVVAMNDPLVLQPFIAKVAALIDERAPLDELDRAWAVLLRLWNAVDRSAPQSAPAGEPGAA
jgi:hypothetical protein